MASPATPTCPDWPIRRYRGYVSHAGTIRLSSSNAPSLSAMHTTATVPTFRGDPSMTLTLE